MALSRFVPFIMTQEEEKNLQRLQTRVRQLILAYQTLESERDELKSRMGQSELALKAEQEKYADLTTAYQRLKTARLLCVAGGDVRDTKQRLSRLIREVDKCIALLNL